MKIQQHGLAIGINRTSNTFFLTLKAVGKLTHEDYETMTPVIESALTGVKNPTINALIDGTELEGWEPRAAGDDFKLGLKHGSQFKNIAIVGNKQWQQVAAKIGTWFVGGQVKYFENETEALGWVMEH
ncbi:STAS/SEC14 domain-containing protein [Halioxenophilus aromaticivorans]|uniref:STAS/SEC14 domain-containing protein n=1 Tax=Halioxenophilus aromaticivorans TaxID=1306992 RepID=A0AAV3U598_9ALTE